MSLGAGLVLALIASLAVAAATVLPAGAGDGAATVAGVQPTEVNLGGQPNDCAAVGSTADHELRIENPQDGNTYNGPDGASITLTVASNDKHMDFVLAGGSVVFDVIVKGGQKSAHFDYSSTDVPGRVTADQELHAPTKGGGSNLFSISHVSFCYEETVCGQTLAASNSSLAGLFVFFNQGNFESDCDDKVGTLSVDATNTLNLPLTGDGEVAGIGTITKTFSGPPVTPPVFEALTYSPTPDGAFEVLPVCGLRTKTGTDGDQFDEYLDDNDTYPSLAGITYPANPAAGASYEDAVTCKVFVSENSSGTQLTVVLVQDDPYWK
jgi:hypothetical protein